MIISLDFYINNIDSYIYYGFLPRILILFAAILPNKAWQPIFYSLVSKCALINNPPHGSKFSPVSGIYFCVLHFSIVHHAGSL